MIQSILNKNDWPGKEGKRIINKQSLINNNLLIDSRNKKKLESVKNILISWVLLLLSQFSVKQN